MTNLLKNTVTTDVKEEVLNKLVAKIKNPHWQLYQDYTCHKISIDELHKILRGKLLKSVYKMKREKYPSKPTKETPENMQGWGRACNHIDCVNTGNKYWLGVLLSDVIKGKLEAEQSKEEEIEELLSEYISN